MRLGEYIANYRFEHDLSQRQFAAKCGLSNGYISMLENNMNPKTKQPIVPSLDQLSKISSFMNISLAELFEAVDDMPISLDCLVKRISSPTPDHLADLISRLDEIDKMKTEAYVEGLLSGDKYQERKEKNIG